MRSPARRPRHSSSTGPSPNPHSIESIKSDPPQSNHHHPGHGFTLPNLSTRFSIRSPDRRSSRTSQLSSMTTTDADADAQEPLSSDPRARSKKALSLQALWGYPQKLYEHHHHQSRQGTDWHLSHHDPVASSASGMSFWCRGDISEPSTPSVPDSAQNLDQTILIQLQPEITITPHQHPFQLLYKNQDSCSHLYSPSHPQHPGLDAWGGLQSPSSSPSSRSSQATTLSSLGSPTYSSHQMIKTHKSSFHLISSPDLVLSTENQSFRSRPLPILISKEQQPDLSNKSRSSISVGRVFKKAMERLNR